MNLRRYIDRVVLINLPRRPDRLAQAQAALRACAWPFKQPEIFAARDGLTVPCPPEWKSGLGAWGCMLSHRQVLAQALADGVNSLMILEDDVCFVDDFRARVEAFLRIVPNDWDQLMLGGAHINQTGEPTLVKPGVVRCTDCERAHCHIVRGGYLRLLYERLLGGGKFNGTVHCDWIMGRDPALQLAHQVYAPELFLAGQEGSQSDINGRWQPRKFWNPPGPDLAVVNLHAPPAVAAALQKLGFYFGTAPGLRPGSDLKLAKIFATTRRAPAARTAQLGLWIKEIQWELAGDPRLVCTVWHPQATATLVKAASLWKVYEINADSVEEALKQLPPKLRKRLAGPNPKHLDGPGRPAAIKKRARKSS